MNAPPDLLRRRLLFLLHQGLVEMRSLALDYVAEATHHERGGAAGQDAACRRDGVETARQIAGLADVLEILPSYLQDWKDDHLRRIRADFQRYQSQFRETSFDYLKFLEEGDPAGRF